MAGRDLITFLTTIRSQSFGDHEQADKFLRAYLGEPFVIRWEQFADGTGTDDGAGAGADTANTTSPVSRRVLISIRRSVCFKDEYRDDQLVRVCNGFVLEYPSWNVLAVPPPVLFRTRTSTIDFTMYNISNVSDGTTVTAYWYKDAWCLATKNGYDVSAYTWLGKTTYADALDQCLRINAGADDTQCKGMDSLRRDCCYSIGFRHHDFHPLLDDPQRAWLVNMCETSRLNVHAGDARTQTHTQPMLVVSNNKVTADSIGIPLPEVRWFAMSNESLSKLSSQRHYDINRSISMTISDENRNNVMNSSRRSRTPGRPHYGFVLRCSQLRRPDDSGVNSGQVSTTLLPPDFIIESELLQYVRDLIYNLRDNIRIPMPDSASRVRFIVIRAYISERSRDKFISMFPQYKKMYDCLRQLFSRLTRMIVERLNDASIPVSTAGAVSTDGTTKDPLIVKLADLIAAKIKHHVHVGNSKSMIARNLSSLIHNFLHDRRYLSLYHVGFANALEVC